MYFLHFFCDVVYPLCHPKWHCLVENWSISEGHARTGENFDSLLVTVSWWPITLTYSHPSHDTASMLGANASHEEHLLHLHDHRVFICRSCRHALVPGKSIERHLRTLHKIIDLQIRKGLIQYSKSVQLIELRTANNSSIDSDSIEGLSLYDGWMCNDCGYTCRSEESTREHCRAGHEWIKEWGVRWEKRKIQTFFEGSNRKYFLMILSITEVDELPTMDCLINVLLDEVKDKDGWGQNIRDWECKSTHGG